jgi:hypothetical protein
VPTIAPFAPAGIVPAAPILSSRTIASMRMQHASIDVDCSSGTATMYELDGTGTVNGQRDIQLSATALSQIRSIIYADVRTQTGIAGSIV